VNFPLNIRGGIEWVRQSVRGYSGQVVPGMDPMGRKHYWFAAKPLVNPDQGTDRWAIENGSIALTPLRLEVTDTQRLSELQQSQEAVQMRAAFAEVN